MERSRRGQGRFPGGDRDGGAEGDAGAKVEARVGAEVGAGDEVPVATGAEGPDTAAAGWHAGEGEPDVGVRLKRLREMMGLSQRELAKRAGVSNATISGIEQNRASPSVGSLKKVLDGIPISLADFFALDDRPRGPVVFRAAELTEIAGPGASAGGLSFRQIGRDLTGKAMQVIHERYARGADTGAHLLSHRGEEAGVVVRGTIELTVAGRVSRLGPGDAYYFDSRLPHRFRNAGDEPAEIVSACSPPGF
jgi:transcriptional regulator with XRE-family HTH domain